MISGNGAGYPCSHRGVKPMRSVRIAVGPEERRELESILRRQYVVRDEQDFITSFDPSEGDSLQDVIDDLIAHFSDPDGEGYDETDMVVWRDGRIAAVVHRDEAGQPQATVFEHDLS
jgi:hypothetical protein